MNCHRKELLTYLNLLHSCFESNDCDVSKDWHYKNSADLLLREGKFFRAGKVVRWPESVAKGCFRNAAMYAMLNDGYRYVEGFALSVIPIHHGWCLDERNCIVEVTWNELGTIYFGVEFRPQLIFKGSVLFNHKNKKIHRRPLNDLRSKKAR